MIADKKYLENAIGVEPEAFKVNAHPIETVTLASISLISVLSWYIIFRLYGGIGRRLMRIMMSANHSEG